MKLIKKLLLGMAIGAVALFAIVIWGPQDEAAVAEQRCLEQIKVAGEWVPKHSAEYRMRCMEDVRKTYGKSATD